MKIAFIRRSYFGKIEIENFLNICELLCPERSLTQLSDIPQG